MTTLYLIRGLPGSGKSTLARRLAKEKNINHFENDKFMTGDDGTYRFTLEGYSIAKDLCFEKVIDFLARGEDVVVSNCFITKWSVLDYVKEALFIPDMKIFVVECNGEYQNVHNVPENTLISMKKNYRSLPELESFLEGELVYDGLRFENVTYMKASEFIDVNFTTIT